jgi:hypothetical protein
VSLAGCPTTTTTATYTPITGILIRASALEEGHGCGTGANQVYKYAALLSYANDAGGPTLPIVESGVFDCYTDGLFSNLSASDSGSLDFAVTIYAWNQAAFPPGLACPPGGSAGGDAAACPGDNPNNIVTADAGTPTWTTTCTGTQQSGVSVLAVCGPLQATASDGGADASVSETGSADATGEAASTGEAGSGTDGEADGSGDAAGDASGGDGGAD